MNTPQLLQSLPATDSPLRWLLALMNDGAADARTRLSAAVACLPYMHARKADAVAKAEAQQAARKAGAGKYGAGRPPVRLVSQQ